MARIRTIKPEFWDDEKTGVLPSNEKCLFLAILNFADDEGLLSANPIYLKAKAFPYFPEIKDSNIKQMLNTLSKAGLIFVYTQNHKKYLWVIRFRNHQRIDKPQKAKNPAPSINNGQYRMMIHERDRFICHLCGDLTVMPQDGGASLNKVNSKVPSVDHLIPKSKNGNNYPSNLKTACISCNKSRGDKEMNEMNDWLLKKNAKKLG